MTESQLQFEYLEPEGPEEILGYLKKTWGSSFVISLNHKHFYKDLHLLLAYENNIVVGILSYVIKDDVCEIVTMNSLEVYRGIGTIVLNEFIKCMQDQAIKRIWLVTTNDNIPAQQFYTKNGFFLKEVHYYQAVVDRKKKKDLPLAGYMNIPIVDEFEYEYEGGKEETGGQDLFKSKL